MQDRLKNYALSIIFFTEQLPDVYKYKVVTNQIIRSSSSSAANYRAACRARSAADFIAKMGIVEEELDETLFWLEFIIGISDKWELHITPLSKEGNELLAIIVSSIVTAKKNNSKNK